MCIFIMELTLLLIITAIFMSCVECGEKPRPCCVPAVFQCKMDVTGGLVNIQNNDLEFYDRRVHLFYDYERKMTRTDTNVTLDNGMEFTQTEIVDYVKKKTYKIDAGRCSVENLTVAMQDQCIPGFAKFIAQGTAGPPNNSVAIQLWRYSDPSTNGTVMRAVTVPDCWPVYQTEYGVFGYAYTVMKYTTADIDINPFPADIMTHPTHCHW